MPSDLKPSEKEEKEVERLIGRKPAPSRKKAPRRGPKHDNRRRRMSEDDSDVKSDDKDMSLNHKVVGSIALRVAETFQSSYGVQAGREMSVKTATYHGVVKQGHPDGPYPGYRSYDSRYFGKDQYESIVASAKSLLKEDWLSNEWTGGAPDAPFRAALDLAIHTADDCLYQSKIDVETYNMLLARVQGDKMDQFSETFLPNTDAPKRSASAMSNAYKNLLRIASELRQTDPKAAVEIVRNMRSLVAQQQGEEQGMHPAPVGQQQQSQQQQGQQQQSQQEQQGQQQGYGQQQQGYGQQQQGQQEQQGAGKETDVKALKEETKKLFDAKDIEDFIESLKDLADTVKKTAGRRIASDLPDLSGLEDMSDEDVKKFLDEQKKGAKELEKHLSEDDLEAFMKGLDELFKDVGEAAKHIKTSSVRVNISSLVRLAASNPEARAFLMPVLIAAKKKVEKAKKKGKKTSQQEKKGQQEKQSKKDKPKAKKENPFAKGKGAPPFGGKKAPPFGKGKKKKASVGIDSSDLNW